MEIRCLKVDFDKDILEINGTQIKDRPVLVSLPGPDGWKFKKVFNPNLTENGTKACDLLNVIYEERDKKARRGTQYNIKERREHQENFVKQ